METLAAPLTPDDIDLGFVAELVPDLEVATIGDEQVVIGGATQLVVLNPTAALIFQFLDGEASLGELVDDFTDVLGVDRTVVEDDVLTFVRELGANGLLEGVALPTPESCPTGRRLRPRRSPSHPATSSTTSPCPTSTAPSARSPTSAGKRVLLVNWSPGCGFCVKIAGELAALAPAPRRAATSTCVFVTIGDADANRAVFDDAGLTAPIAVARRHGRRPVPGHRHPRRLPRRRGRSPGREDGRRRRPGADAGARPRRRRSRTPYGVVDEPDDAVDGPRSTTTRCAASTSPRRARCAAPEAAAGAPNSTDWKGTRAYAIGDYHVGLRYDVAETADVLDRLFAGARVNDRRVPDNYSVALGGTPTTKGAGASRSLKLLVHGSTQLVRSRSGGRVLAGLLQHLSADLEPADPAFMRVNATAVVRDGDALLLPRRPGRLREAAPAAAGEVGARASSTRPARCSTSSTRELVVPEPTVPYDASVLAELDDGVKLGQRAAVDPPGPLPAAHLVPHPQPRAPRSAQPRGRGDRGVPDAVRPRRPRRRRSSALADLLHRRCRPYGIWYESADDLVDQVVAGSADDYRRYRRRRSRNSVTSSADSISAIISLRLGGHRLLLVGARLGLGGEVHRVGVGVAVVVDGDDLADHVGPRRAEHLLRVGGAREHARRPSPGP